MTHNTSSPYILKVLDVSTSHITDKDDKLLAGSDFPGCAISYAYGYSVIVLKAQPDIVESYRRYGMSEEFCRVYTWAEKLDVAEVRFDRDGTVYEDLPEFDW